MPTLALNTAGLSADGSERATTAALAAGFRHVDFHPGIERDGVARALASAGLGRSEDRLGRLFLTTKIAKPPPGSTPAQAAEAVRRQIDSDLAVLGTDAVDMLMLRDSPSCEVMQAQWAALEDARAAGRSRALGTVNFCEGALRCILQTAKTPPALNYVMEHVGMGEDAYGLRGFGEARGVRTFAYGALGEPGPSAELLASPVLRRIGEAHGRSAEEVALRWVVQRGCAVSVRPTADFGMGRSTCATGGACAAGLRARAQVFEWDLAAADITELSALRSPAGNPTIFSSTGCPDSFFAAK